MSTHSYNCALCNHNIYTNSLKVIYYQRCVPGEKVVKQTKIRDLEPAIHVFRSDFHKERDVMTLKHLVLNFVKIGQANKNRLKSR